ncbi:MAG: hypothetical protein JXR40_09430 [Pontiellaceae bacterium]|nr:hypothetical protein [Pontiellaceae bacterium]
MKPIMSVPVEQEAAVIGADSRRNSKSGQAMVEFLLGLIGILVIVLSLELMSSFVVEDFDAMYDARTEVARSLVYNSGGAVDGSTANSQSYASSVLFYHMLLDDIKYDRTKSLQGTYPPRDEEVNGFDIVAVGDPLSDFVGVVVPASVPVQTDFLRKALGRNSVRKVNAVWVPPWDDLMGAEEEE